jgi:hypothetical protein
MARKQRWQFIKLVLLSSSGRVLPTGGDALRVEPRWTCFRLDCFRLMRIQVREILGQTNDG